MLRLYFRTTLCASDSSKLFCPKSEAWDSFTHGSGGKPTTDVRAVVWRQWAACPHAAAVQSASFPLPFMGREPTWQLPTGQKNRKCNGGGACQHRCFLSYQWPAGSIVELKELKANLCHLCFCKSLSSRQEDTSCCVWHFLELFCLTSLCSHCWWDPTPSQKKSSAKHRSHAAPSSLPLHSAMGWRWKAAWGTDRQLPLPTATPLQSSVGTEHGGRTQQHLPKKIQPQKSWGLLPGIAFPRVNGQQTEGNTISTST